MRHAGQIVAKVHAAMRERAKPGVTTGELNDLAEEIIRSEDAIPSFKGYGRPPFPATICASIDNELVHGIPSPKRVLKDGQIFSVDVGAIYKGYHGDAAITLPIGKISDQAQELLVVTEGALSAGIGPHVPAIVWETYPLQFSSMWRAAGMRWCASIPAMALAGRCTRACRS